jgi:hypothetical protein
VGAARAQHLSDVEVEVDAEWLNTYLPSFQIPFTNTSFIMLIINTYSVFPLKNLCSIQKFNNKFFWFHINVFSWKSL